MKSIPAIFGIEGLHLTDGEIEFFKEYKPFGVILFARNIENREQIINLTGSLRRALGDDLKILIDQEGGRVARIKPPIMKEYPAPNTLKTVDETYDNYFSLGRELKSLGINVNCAPLADLHYEYADKIIGNRSFGSDPKHVADMCRAVMSGLRDAEVEPVLKHIPGHGRALCDSHLALPSIDIPLDELERTDFLAFKLLADLDVMLMTAHITYKALDTENCVTMSATAIQYIRNQLGFKDNLIMTDDINMKALNGSVSKLATAALEAGCDIVLHCNGNLDEMKEIGQSRATS